MKKSKKLAIIVAVLLSIVTIGVVYAARLSPYSDSCGKCDIHDSVRKCGKCSGFLSNYENKYENGYLYSYYQCKKCGHNCWHKQRR